MSYLIANHLNRLLKVNLDTLKLTSGFIIFVNSQGATFKPNGTQFHTYLSSLQIKHKYLQQDLWRGIRKYASFDWAHITAFRDNLVTVWKSSILKCSVGINVFNSFKFITNLILPLLPLYKLFQIVKFHYLKEFIYTTKIVNAHYFGVHIHYFGSDLLITTTIVKFHYFTFRE